MKVKKKKKKTLVIISPCQVNEFANINFTIRRALPGRFLGMLITNAIVPREITPPRSRRRSWKDPKDSIRRDSNAHLTAIVRCIERSRSLRFFSL